MIDPEEIAAITWWHTIDLGDGQRTPGLKGDAAYMTSELELLRMPDLRGKRVLDIGTWDGFYAFEAERRGAAHVVALDGFVWQLDIAAHLAAHARGELLPLLRFDPQATALPGKAGFDLAHRALGSSVEPLVCDVMEISPEIGVFDVVLYLGVLYHMEDPLAAVRRLSSVTQELAIVETQATEIPGHETLALWEFFPGDECNHDPSNWWAPNCAALRGILVAAGFPRVEIVSGPPDGLREPWRGRVIAHAYK